jgi:hypothetical protein
MVAVLIGCGGGGGGGGKNNNPTTGTTSGVPGATQPGDSIAMVNLPKPIGAPGRLNVAYLPLQGRLALETFSVLIRNIEIGLDADIFVEPLATPITFVLNGAEVQQRSASIGVDNGISRPFNTFYLNIDTFTDNDSGVIQTFGDSNNPFVQEQPFSANIRVFPSRETTVPIFLNDSMVEIISGDTSTTADFLPDVFVARNGSPIKGFLSDFLEFDVSSMAGKRPIMSNGQTANRAYFSGDKFALSQAGPSGYFEMLTEDLSHPDPGQFTEPTTVNNTTAPGIYRTLAPDPTDPTHTNQITELIGIVRWFVDPQHDANSMVVDAGHFEVILMPEANDDDTQQILLVALNGNKATNMYWGDAHLGSGSFVAYPLANLTTGLTTGAIQGTLSGFLDANAASVSVNTPSAAQNVRYGRYAISGSLPTGFSQSGRFIVFRA